MYKYWLSALPILLLTGCGTPGSHVPVIEGTGRPPASMNAPARPTQPEAPVAQAIPQSVGSGITVMTPSSQPLQTTPLQTQPLQTPPLAMGSTPMMPSAPGTTALSAPGMPQSSTAINPAAANVPVPVYNPAMAGNLQNPSAGLASAGAAAAGAAFGNTPAAGNLTSLLASAREQQFSGNLDGASASLERAQRMAPNDPQVLYRLGEVRLSQGNPAQAEQLARRGLTLSASNPSLTGSLWDLIARSKEKQGDRAGAAEARSHAISTQ